uniref:Uncharacterized protein n=1 Tax=Arundo donax TaxID=35708 RepID=A0A0A9A8J9_ARUDO
MTRIHNFVQTDKTAIEKAMTKNRRNRTVFENCYSTKFDKPNSFLSEAEQFYQKL